MLDQKCGIPYGGAGDPVRCPYRVSPDVLPYRLEPRGRPVWGAGWAVEERTTMLPKQAQNGDRQADDPGRLYREEPIDPL